jgi:methionine synthase I (cobalamin-dependent)
MPNFRDALERGEVVLFDGAMGTEIYRRGVFINQCYDELSRSEPETVREIHEAYRRAGAQALETNTFGANRYQLQSYGLEEEVGEINRAAARLAREVAGEELFVAGSLGPLGIRLEPYGPTSREEARAAFREQADALVEGGVDLLLLETFSDLAELREAVRGCREATDLPVVAQMTVQPDGETSYGDRPSTIAREVEGFGVDAVGLNCSVGPALLVEAVREMAGVTSLPISAMPNAGLPKEVQGRKIYLASPEYMASYARKLVEAGARILGGCCGTRPEHVRKMADQLRALSPDAVRVTVREEEGGEEGLAAEEGRAQVAAAVCVETFMAAPDAGLQLASLKENTSSWRQENFIEEGGWAMIGDQEYDGAAELCADRLVEMEAPAAQEAAATEPGPLHTLPWRAGEPSFPASFVGNRRAAHAAPVTAGRGRTRSPVRRLTQRLGRNGGEQRQLGAVLFDPGGIPRVLLDGLVIRHGRIVARGRVNGCQLMPAFLGDPIGHPGQARIVGHEQPRGLFL